MKIYFPLLISLAIYTSTPSNCMSQSLLDTLCSEKTIAQTGNYSGFNRVHCKRAVEPLRTLKPQVGNTCTCEALLNVAFELGISGTIEEVERKHNCNGANFADLFGDYAASKSPLEGKVFGGLVGAWKSKSLVSSAKAMRTIVQAVANKQVVAISLNVTPIYDDYSSQNKTSYEGVGVTGAHALLVRALYKDSNGEVTHFVVIDSSGPERLYAIPYNIFVNAYTKMTVKLSRGVYVSNAQRKGL